MSSSRAAWFVILLQCERVKQLHAVVLCHRGYSNIFTVPLSSYYISCKMALVALHTICLCVTGRVIRRPYFSWVDPSEIAPLCMIYTHNYKHWIKTYKLKVGSTRILMKKEEKQEVDKLGEFRKDGMSSKEGVAKLCKLQLYIDPMSMKGIEDKVKFDSAFWDYYDTHIARIIRQQRNINAPRHKEVTPKDCRKQRENKQLQQEMQEIQLHYAKSWLLKCNVK